MQDRITDKQAALLKKRGVDVNYNMSKNEASKLIDEILNKKLSDEPKKAEFTPRNYGSQAPMWGRYAADLVIAMIEKKGDKENFDVIEASKLAIQIVLSMQNQFKE